MPVYRLTKRLAFPPPEGASPEGLVAVGGDLSPARLVLGYSQGIFPWPHEGYPLLWFSPDPRHVLPLDEVHLPRSLRKRMRREEYEVRIDHDYRAALTACQRAPRRGQDGTWITDELLEAYVQLHELGFAHSVEAYRDGAMVGAVCGVALGAAFMGDTMFASAPDASKVAFASLLDHLRRWGFRFVDAQVETEHLTRFGAVPWSRTKFLDELGKAVSDGTRWGRAPAASRDDPPPDP